jgi:hypothetical protein
MQRLRLPSRVTGGGWRSVMFITDLVIVVTGFGLIDLHLQLMMLSMWGVTRD